jgi:hypothetical protein
LLSFRFLRHSQFGALARYTFFSTGDLGSPVCFLFVFPRPFSALARFNFFGLRQLGAYSRFHLLCPGSLDPLS